MRFIKRVLHYLALLLAGGFFGCGVSTMCALLALNIDERSGKGLPLLLLFISE